MFEYNWHLSRKLVIHIMCYPHHWGFHWRENGARLSQHFLDTTLMIGPWSFNLMYFLLGRWARLLRWIPTRRNGRGFQVGW